MTMQEFKTELEKLRSGYAFDTTRVTDLYTAALARAEAAEALARRNNDDAATAEAKVLGLEFENERLAARVAELEAQLAAQGWRDFTEHPPIGEPIQIVTVIDAVREGPDVLYRIGHTSEWQTWRPAPPEPTP